MNDRLNKKEIIVLVINLLLNPFLPPNLQLNPIAFMFWITVIIILINHYFGIFHLVLA
jgi:hypothetical protein